MTDFRNFFAGEGGGVGETRGRRFKYMQNCLLGERGEAPTLRVGEHVLYAVPFSELRIFSWRLGKNPSIGNNLVIAEIFSFSPDK